MKKMLDAMDALNRARDLNRMAALATQYPADEDDHARAALAEAIELRFEEAFELLEEARLEAGGQPVPGKEPQQKETLDVAAE